MKRTHLIKFNIASGIFGGMALGMLFGSPILGGLVGLAVGFIFNKKFYPKKT